LVCLAHADGNDATSALAEAVNADGSVYVTTSTIGSRSFIRVAVGATATTERDVERLWSIMLDALAGARADR
jgi:aromatic-L-amino-acid decarboxylase